MRRRIVSAVKEPTLEAVKQLDAFPKVSETYRETTVTGGGISLITFIFIAILVISEIRYYSQTKLKYDYEVDKEFGKQVKINIDMTVAMKCHQIGADIVDVTGAGAETFGNLDEEEVYFQLSPLQQLHFDNMQSVTSYIRNSYSSIHELLWKSDYKGIGSMPTRETPPPNHPPDACRIHGSLVVNKVAGNFHITAGKNLPIVISGHAHLAVNIPQHDYNFSHRIDHFSFGEITPGIVNSLDGDMKIVDSNLHLFNYFIEIIPTRVETSRATVDTYQFASTEKDRSIDHGKGSHGVPGIFMKYDINSFKVHVKETHDPYTQFFIRLIGIVGGIFATSGLLHSIVQVLVDVACCRFKLSQSERQNSTEPTSTTTSLVTPETPATFTNQVIAPSTDS